MVDLIRWEHGTDGVVVLTIDDPAQSANTMHARFFDALVATVDRLVAEREQITGVILTSAKPTFVAGGDLTEMRTTTAADAPAVFASVERVKAALRRLETLGRPVVAAINGAALGGGLEIALACHHRIVLDGPSTRVGLPEVTLGLLPGGGGIVRTVRMLGLTTALDQVLLSGRRYRPDEAARLGLVDEVVATRDELLTRARAWIAANPSPAQPWDRAGYALPGGLPDLPALPARLHRDLRGANYPAPRAILAAAVEGAQVGVDTAGTIETRYLVELMIGQESKNLIQARFFDLRRVRSGVGPASHRAHRVLVLGAGLMGAGIAYTCAHAGLEVVLKDVTLDAARRGKAYAERLVAKGRGDASLLDRITPTGSAADGAGADLVIEAVFEDPALKRAVFAEVERIVAPDAVLATNTSTLPVTGLAAGDHRFVGLHFFSPVERMELLEVIVGEKTSDATLARALGIARQLGKTPIVVNDSRGFFTSRVIIRYLEEAAAMLAEGVSPSSIEQAGLQAGYPVPPLQLLDELALPLIRRIRQEAGAAFHVSATVIDRMIDEFRRPGRSGGAGFYSYHSTGRRAGLWSGLAAFGRPGALLPPIEDLRERLLFVEALDSVRCLDEGVLRSVPDANVGSILGIGFPAWTGGVLQYINQYPGGPAGFVARAEELAGRYGPRLTPPESLVARAAAGELYR
ncbi:3-hydroxyacyl-CoA dehydrogenase NAD-binding domain-containing protein [Dactylosporangium sp. AC04546]|uniref:3-hydroxyacyl-CoA dehydrogenase NAD-binding domain-containing protein n=1 Tax=Dactylosporangium sp. AC04546 TaxID=2862460 RepID=UPI001EDD0635|nr:3-hydroxyacyl-CoA dehydrogenase NAD-binding domain-containing protein [Dactylosporangium sp. AC04546]WVK88782.1 3-hydroxyacyl-CoA dehydrogenase NAD-binding domain-containing protein [Dactylosporangium sp. AC04546]